MYQNIENFKLYKTIYRLVELSTNIDFNKKIFTFSHMTTSIEGEKIHMQKEKSKKRTDI
jgi:hypothetical protein